MGKIVRYSRCTVNFLLPFFFFQFKHVQRDKVKRIEVLFGIRCLVEGGLNGQYFEQGEKVGVVVAMGE